MSEGDQAPDAESSQEDRLRSIEVAIVSSMMTSTAELRETVAELGRALADQGRALADHIAHADQVGKIVRQSALEVQAHNTENKQLLEQGLELLRSFRRFPREAEGMEYAGTNSELAQPVPERDMAERSRKDAGTMRWQRDLLTYGLPLLGIVVAAFAILPLHLPLAQVVLAYIVLILGGGSLAAAWVFSAFREILKRPRR